MRVREQLYAEKLNNLDEMDKFLEAQNLPRLNHEEIDNLNRLLISKEIESAITKISRQRKVLVLLISLVNSTKYLKKNTFSNIFKKLKSTLCNSFYESGLRQTKTTRKENNRPMYMKNTANNTQW